MGKAIEKNPGFTLRSFLASLCGIALAAFLVQFFEVVEGSHEHVAGQAVPLIALYVFVPLVVLAGMVLAASRHQLLTRSELLVVFFAGRHICFFRFLAFVY